MRGAAAGRAGARGVFVALALLAGLLAPPPAAAQAVLLVDRERLLAESAPALALKELEQARRLDLRGELDALRAALEAEEGEIAALRGRVAPEEFEARVRAFDQRVRDARRVSQQRGEALQGAFAAARRQLAEAIIPILADVSAERGGAVVLDAKFALWVGPDVDVTDIVMRRLATVQIDFGLPPAPPGEQD